MDIRTEKKRISSYPYIRLGHEFIVLGLLIAILVIISVFSGRMLTFSNLMSMMRSFTEIAMVVLPMTFIVMTGGIDLSVGSIMALSVVVFGTMFSKTENLLLCILITLVTGALCGFINGLCIGYLKLTAWVVTLCGMYIFEGLALGISMAQTYYGFPESFYFIGQGYIAGIPMQVLLLLILIAIFSFLLSATTFGRSLRAVGFNALSARFSGINVSRTLMLVYTLCGLVASIAGLTYVSRISIAKADAGVGYTMDCVTAIVLGGVSIAGGIGSIRGAMLGVITVGFLRSGMTMIRVPSEVTSVIIGTILIVTVILSRFFENSRSSRKSNIART